MKPADTAAQQPDGRDFDVVIVGGSLAGGGTALALLRERPALRILVVERLETLDRRVGESTVELSTYYLTRVLGLTRHLNENHIVKQGFRFWFDAPGNDDMGRCTEMGGSYLTRVTSFQLDREVLDAHVADLTREDGATWWRPASVRSVELVDGGLQTLVIRRDGVDRTVRARWVVDATGRHCMLARKHGWHTPTPGHETSSVWARFRNVGDFDGRDLLRRHPDLARGVFGMRHPATNHLLGDGWWAWMIPLKNGDMSVGVTWDRTRFTWPRGSGSLGEQLRTVIESHPVGREITRDAELIDGDVHTLRNLPYTSTTYAGDGFALVGDAGGFIDPFYSMGLDSLAMSSTSAVQMIVTGHDGGDIAAEVARHNATFRATYRRWFEGIYRDKYAYMGDYELMYVAFILEVGMYYLGVVRGPYVNGKGALLDGVFYRRASLPAYALLRHVGRRLAAMAEDRHRRGVWGRRNVGHRRLVPGFNFTPGTGWSVGKALAAYLKLELTEGWRSWFGSRRATRRRAAAGSVGVGEPAAEATPA